MVLSFLTQLAMPGGLKGTKESTGESDHENAHRLRAKHKIEMRLADRTKIDSQGWVIISSHLHLKSLRDAKNIGIPPSNAFDIPRNVNMEVQNL
jgi:hypothetical protein